MIPIGWFGVGSGAFADPDGVAEIAEAAESLGFESIWVGEHPVLIDPHVPPSPLPSDSELMDPIPVLAYAAARTTRIKLGTGIVILPLRNPVILAKELASVDVLSRGRLLVGVGVGYVPGEYDAIGVPFHTRGRRADEWIDALRTLWRDDRPELRGEFASFGGIQCRPRPRQPGGPPILASGMSTAARRRAVARCEGWYGFFQDLDATRRRDRRAHPAGRRGGAAGGARPARDHHHPGSRARSTPTPCAATRTSASTASCSCTTSPTWRVDPTRRGVACSSARWKRVPTGCDWPDRERQGWTWQSTKSWPARSASALDGQ